MQTSSKIFRLKGVVQHYNWGGHRFLPELLGMDNPSFQPFAEYWMGAHANAPAQIQLEDGTLQPLNIFIRENGIKVLGDKVSRRFGTLPYLFKILDVKDMLSIQVHPNKKTAVIEFEAENKKGIPVNDSQRNYKDDNHKPELMMAWSDFWLLHGFKSPELLERVLNRVPELNFLLPVWKKSGYEGIYKTVMEMNQPAVNKILQPLIDRILPLYELNQLKKSEEDFWAARAYLTFYKDQQFDRGLFSMYFFNLVNLKPGEAIFQDAGILHAYLEGQNLEIMANSDNVLRGGLTNKKIDVPELLKLVRFEPVVPQIIKGLKVNDSMEEAFITPAADFELRRIILASNTSTEIVCHTTDIFLVMMGTINAIADKLSIPVQKGESFLCTEGVKIHLHSGAEGAVVFHATVPE